MARGDLTAVQQRVQPPQGAQPGLEPRIVEERDEAGKCRGGGRGAPDAHRAPTVDDSEVVALRGDVWDATALPDEPYY